MPDSEELQALRDELGQVKESNLHLARQVGHLTEAISTVNKVRREQVQIKQSVAKVTETTATKDDLEQESKKREKVHKASRNRFLLNLVFGAAILVLVIAVGLSYQSFRQQSYEVCSQRSDQSNRVRTFLLESQKEQLAKAPNELVRRQIRQMTTQLLAAFPEVNCEDLRPSWKPDWLHK